MQKRLAFLLPDMRGGGAERVALTLIRHFVAQGHHVDLLLMKARGELLPEVPPAVRVVDFGAGRIRQVFPRLFKYFRREHHDALQVFMWPLTIIGILAHTLSRSTSRLVVSDHALLSDHYSSPLQHRLIRATIRMFYPWADARVAVSHGAANDAAALSRLPASAFTVIPNPIEFPPEPVRKTEVEALWAGAGKRILSLGHLSEVKQQDLLIRSFARLPANLEPRLIIAGEGPLRSSLENLARVEGVGDRVEFPGYAADPWPFYASADLFVLPSHEESFGNVLVEAMYAGLPIVSTRTTGAVEILNGGEFGTLVADDPAALASAIEVALAKPHDRERGRKRALELSGRSVERYDEVMTGTCESQP